MSVFSGLHHIFPTVIFYLDAKPSSACRSSDGDLSTIRTTCDAVADRILHNRLQQKPGDLRLISFCANAQRDSQARSKTDLFDGEVFLCHGQLFSQGNKMSFRDN